MIDFNQYPSPAAPKPMPATLPAWAIANDVHPILPSESAGPAIISDVEFRNFGPPIIETARVRKFVAEDFDTLEPHHIGWRIKGLMPAVGVGVIAGPSMSGKSFLALHALAAICQGREVFGLKTKPCGGVYIAAEDAPGVRLRIKALRNRVGKLGGAFGFVGQAPDLSDGDDIDEIRELVAERRSQSIERGFDLGVIVIDTFSASVPGADENSARDMSPILAALQQMAQDFGVLVLVVAHTGKDEARGIRGWSGFKANSDCVVLVEAPDAESVRVVTADKVKNGLSGARFAFSLETVTLGTDEDGDPITTCVVREEAAAPAAKSRTRPLTPNAQIALRALGYLIDNGHGQPAPGGPGIKPGAKAVTLDVWRERAMASGLADAEAGPTALRKRWFDAKAALIAASKVRVEGEFAILITE